VLVSAYDRGVDHHVFVVGVARQQLEVSWRGFFADPSRRGRVDRSPISLLRSRREFSIAGMDRAPEEVRPGA
jgi:hypothetical protein